jgi:diphosphomevalonate decarboxylase
MNPLNYPSMPNDAAASPVASQPYSASVRAGSNIAFIKYWGVRDASLNLPLSNSISMTLESAHTTTALRWDVTGELAADDFTIDGTHLGVAAAARLTRHLDRIRALAGVSYRAAVQSRNNFPMASGIASSASGFAALTVAACAALGLDYDLRRLSAIARRGSGSASRSLFGGFVEWQAGEDDASSVAAPLFPPEHWQIYDIVAVVSSAQKAISSEAGHSLAATSPLNAGRIDGIERALAEVRAAIATRDLPRLGVVIEQDALAMHAVMMTSTPSLLYWQPATLELLHAVRRWREDDKLPVYFTIDAGPNVHLICEAGSAPAVHAQLGELACVQKVIVSAPGPAPLRLA